MRDGFRSEVILCVCLCASPTVNVQTFMPYSHQHRRPVSNRCQWTAAHRLMTLGFTLVLVLSLLLSWVCAGLRRSACRLFLWALGPSYQYFSGHGTVGVECIQALCLFECTKSIYILWDSRIHRHPSILPLPSLDSNSTERLSAYLNHTLTRPHCHTAQTMSDAVRTIFESGGTHPHHDEHVPSTATAWADGNEKLQTEWSAYMRNAYAGRKPPSIESYTVGKLEERAREATEGSW